MHDICTFWRTEIQFRFVDLFKHRLWRRSTRFVFQKLFAIESLTSHGRLSLLATMTSQASLKSLPAGFRLPKSDGALKNAKARAQAIVEDAKRQQAISKGRVKRLNVRSCPNCHYALKHARFAWDAFVPDFSTH
jgi:hypothetical protein